MLEIKICGVGSEEIVEAAIEGGATHLGLVHFVPSPRHLPVERIAALVRAVAGRARTVVLSVDADDALLDRLAATGADMLQLHGRETPARVAAVRRRTGLGIVKALGVSEAADLERARGYEADRLLFDARPPEGARLPGGNGVAFDWSVLDGWRGAPFWLAGGLYPGNVAEAVRRVRPRGIDLSSGVERAPGEKDEGLIRDLFAALSLGPAPVA